MNSKRSFGEPPAVENKNKAKNHSHTQVIVSAVEVSRTKLQTIHQNRYRGSFRVFTRGRGAVMPHTAITNNTPNHYDHAHAYVASCIGGSILMMVFSCLVYQYCKNRLHSDSHHDGERSGGGVATGDDENRGRPQPHQHDAEETAASETRHQFNNSGVSTSEGELSQLTSSFGEGEPVRYCLSTATVQLGPQSSVVVAQNRDLGNNVTVASSRRRSSTTAGRTVSSVATRDGQDSEYWAKGHTLPDRSTHSADHGSDDPTSNNNNYTDISVADNNTDTSVTDNNNCSNMYTSVTDDNADTSVTGNIADMHLYSSVTDSNADMHLYASVTDNNADTSLTDNNADSSVTDNNTDINMTENNADTNVTDNNADSSVTDNNADTNVTDNNAETSVTDNNAETNVTDNNADTNMTGNNCTDTNALTGNNCTETNMTDNNCTTDTNMTDNNADTNMTDNNTATGVAADNDTERVAGSGADEQEPKPSPLTDRASDVSECLATLMLDFSSDRGDGWEGEMNLGGNTSRDTDESVQSYESFSRLQDVKAQAEFSPYHIAWSTPHFPVKASVQARPSRRTTATAKKLNMDFLGKPQRQVGGGAGPGSEQAVTSRSPTRQDTSQSLEDSPPPGCITTAESSALRGWGFLKPEDAWCRPLSAEYRTPRPSASGRAGQRSRNVGTRFGADTAQTVSRERQPLLAYSVAEYRKSLKDIATVVSTTLNTLHVTKPPMKHAETGSSHTPPSLYSYPAGVVSPTLDTFHSVTKSPQKHAETGSSHSSQSFYSSPATLLSESAVRDIGQHREKRQTPLQSKNGQVDVDNTGLRDTTTSRSGTENGVAVTRSTAEERSQRVVNVSEDVLNNNNSNISCKSESPQSCAKSSTLPSVSSPRSPYADSFETDTLSSEATPSSASMGTIPDDSSPEFYAPSSISEGGGTSELENKNAPQVSLAYCGNRSSSPPRESPTDADNFKAPYPVEAGFRSKSSATLSTRMSGDTARAVLPRSKSSSNKPLAQHAQFELGQSQLRRSRTSESISSSTQTLQQRMSLAGSLTDVSVAGTSASRMSLAWDHEFTASGQGFNDSLMWEDDPYLS